MPATAHIFGAIDVLPFEMWLALRARPLIMVVHGRSTRSTMWRLLARHLGLRVQRWIWLLDTAVDDCRVGLDLLASRGASTASLWSPAGPSAALQLFAALDFELPSALLGSPTHIDPIRALSAQLKQPPPFVFPHTNFGYAWRGGRHDLSEWLKARGGVGARLLALRSVGAQPRIIPDPGFLAALDVRVRRLARLGEFPLGAQPNDERHAAWSETVREGRMLADFSVWLNDAERCQRGGLPIDFALPRLLGLSETAQLRIIP